MKYKGTLLVVKDCDQALKYYHDMFGLQLLQDNDGNMELTGGLYLQEAEYWVKFLDKSITPKSNSKPIEAAYPKRQTLSGKLIWIELMILARMSAIAH